MRTSEAEREAVVARLGQACSEGRLTLDEFGERVERAYEAMLSPDLEALVADLPALTGQAPPLSEATSVKRGKGMTRRKKGTTRWWVSPLGGFHRRGHYRLPTNQVVVTLVGGMDVDLRGAELSGPKVNLTVVSLVGGADVVVPAGVQVEVSGFSVLGGRDVRLGDRVVPGAPLVHLRVFSVLGRARVRSKGRRDRLRNHARGWF